MFNQKPDLLGDWICDFVTGKLEKRKNFAKYALIFAHKAINENGDHFKEITDKSVFINAQFTRSAVEKAENGKCTTSTWSTALIIIRDLRVELLYDTVKNEPQEFIFVIDDFMIYDYRKGLAPLQKFQWCMNYKNVQQAAMSAMEDSSNRCDTQSDLDEDSHESETLSHLVLHVHAAALEDELEREGRESSVTENELLEELRKPFSVENFLIPASQEKLLDAIKEWDVNYRVPSSSFSSGKENDSRSMEEYNVKRISTLPDNQNPEKSMPEVDSAESQRIDETPSQGNSHSLRIDLTTSQENSHSQCKKQAQDRHLDSGEISNKLLEIGSPEAHSTQKDKDTDPDSDDRGGPSNLTNKTNTRNRLNRTNNPPNKTFKGNKVPVHVDEDTIGTSKATDQSSSVEIVDVESLIIQISSDSTQSDSLLIPKPLPVRRKSLDRVAACERDEMNRLSALSSVSQNTVGPSPDSEFSRSSLYHQGILEEQNLLQKPSENSGETSKKPSKGSEDLFKDSSSSAENSGQSVDNSDDKHAGKNKINSNQSGEPLDVDNARWDFAALVRNVQGPNSKGIPVFQRRDIARKDSNRQLHMKDFLNVHYSTKKQKQKLDGRTILQDTNKQRSSQGSDKSLDRETSLDAEKSIMLEYYSQNYTSPTHSRPSRSAMQDMNKSKGSDTPEKSLPCKRKCQEINKGKSADKQSEMQTKESCNEPGAEKTKTSNKLQNCESFNVTSQSEKQSKAVGTESLYTDSEDSSQVESDDCNSYENAFKKYLKHSKNKRKISESDTNMQNSQEGDHSEQDDTVTAKKRTLNPIFTCKSPDRVDIHDTDYIQSLVKPCSVDLVCVEESKLREMATVDKQVTKSDNLSKQSQLSDASTVEYESGEERSVTKVGEDSSETGKQRTEKDCNEGESQSWNTCTQPFEYRPCPETQQSGETGKQGTEVDGNISEIESLNICTQPFEYRPYPETQEFDPVTSPEREYSCLDFKMDFQTQNKSSGNLDKSVKYIITDNVQFSNEHNYRRRSIEKKRMKFMEEAEKLGLHFVKSRKENESTENVPGTSKNAYTVDDACKNNCTALPSDNAVNLDMNTSKQTTCSSEQSDEAAARSTQHASVRQDRDNDETEIRVQTLSDKENIVIDGPKTSSKSKEKIADTFSKEVDDAVTPSRNKLKQIEDVSIHPGKRKCDDSPDKETPSKKLRICDNGPEYSLVASDAEVDYLLSKLPPKHLTGGIEQTQTPVSKEAIIVSMFPELKVLDKEYRLRPVNRQRKEKRVDKNDCFSLRVKGFRRPLVIPPSCRSNESSDVLNESSNVLKEGSKVINESSHVLNECSHVLNKSSDVLNESSDVLNESSNVLKESSHVLNKSSHVLNEKSHVLDESSHVLKMKGNKNGSVNEVSVKDTVETKATLQNETYSVVNTRNSKHKTATKTDDNGKYKKTSSVDKRSETNDKLMELPSDSNTVPMNKESACNVKNPEHNTDITESTGDKPRTRGSVKVRVADSGAIRFYRECVSKGKSPDTVIDKHSSKPTKKLTPQKGAHQKVTSQKITSQKVTPQKDTPQKPQKITLKKVDNKSNSSNKDKTNKNKDKAKGKRRSSPERSEQTDITVRRKSSRITKRMTTGNAVQRPTAGNSDLRPNEVMDKQTFLTNWLSTSNFIVESYSDAE